MICGLMKVVVEVWSCVICGHPSHFRHFDVVNVGRAQEQSTHTRTQLQLRLQRQRKSPAQLLQLFIEEDVKAKNVT